MKKRDHVCGGAGMILFYKKTESRRRKVGEIVKISKIFKKRKKGLTEGEKRGIMYSVSKG